MLRSASSLSEKQPNPEAQKESLLRFADNAQQAMKNTAGKLGELGPPKIPNGQQVHDTAVNFFDSTAKSVADQRSELEKLDAAAPDFPARMAQLTRPDLQATGQQAAMLIGNRDLAPSFKSAPECKQLGALAQSG